MKLLILFSLLNSMNCFAQKSSAFDRITNSVKDYKIDTSAAPNDKITQKIIELRNLRGGFNINEAIEFKIQEEMAKPDANKKELTALKESFTSGIGKKWLDNAMIWIYRNSFSYKELKQLVKFYKTPAGQKLATDFPIIIFKGLAAGEIIQKTIVQNK